MRTTRRLAVAASLAAALLLTLLGITPAWADSIGFDIIVPNAALVPFPSPYAHVDVNRTSATSAIITFTGGSAGGFTYAFGAANAVDVNVNATTFTVGVPSVATLGPTAGSGNVSSFGTFNVTLDNFDGFTSRFSTANFGLTNTSGTWASAANVLTANGDGFSVAAHIFASATNCDGACVTGFAGDGGLAPVPEPVTMLLFGSSLLGVGIAARKKLLSSAA